MLQPQQFFMSKAIFYLIIKEVPTNRMKVVHVFLLLHSASALEDEFYIKRWNLLLSWKALGGVSMCVWSFSASRHLSTFGSARHKISLLLSKVLWIDRNSLYSSQIRHFHHLRQPPPPFSPLSHPPHQLSFVAMETVWSLPSRHRLNASSLSPFLLFLSEGRPHPLPPQFPGLYRVKISGTPFWIIHVASPHQWHILFACTPSFMITNGLH